MLPTTKLGRGIQSCCQEGGVQKIKELPPLAKEHWQEGRCPAKMAMLMRERATRSAERYFTGLQHWWYKFQILCRKIQGGVTLKCHSFLSAMHCNGSFTQKLTQHRQASWVVKIRQIREAVFHSRQLLNLLRLLILTNTKSALHSAHQNLYTFLYLDTEWYPASESIILQLLST